MSSLIAWMPDEKTLVADLTFVPALQDKVECVWKGMSMKFCYNDDFSLAVGNWSQTLALNWSIPLIAAVCYLVGIVVLQTLVAKFGKFDVKGFAFYWNVFLSLFSWTGVFCCAPVLLQALFSNGLYFATCAPAEWYGTGASGVFILLFVLSKLAELVDTLLLVLSGKPVILLHWWHHTTVMLYCWHSYSTRISTGIWFASINYFVHAIMYGYFAATQTSIRKKVFPFAMYITLLQIVQMLVGMWITIKAVFFQMDGQDCNVNKTNSVLGLTMYFSYFVLFGKLFVDHYCLGKKIAQPKAKKEKSIARSISNKVIQSIVDEDDEDEGTQKPSKKTCVGKKIAQPEKENLIARSISNKVIQSIVFEDDKDEGREEDSKKMN